MAIERSFGEPSWSLLVVLGTISEKMPKGEKRTTVLRFCYIFQAGGVFFQVKSFFKDFLLRLLVSHVFYWFLFDFGSILEPSWRPNWSPNPLKIESQITLKCYSSLLWIWNCMFLWATWWMVKWSLAPPRVPSSDLTPSPWSPWWWSPRPSLTPHWLPMIMDGF